MNESMSLGFALCIWTMAFAIGVLTGMWTDSAKAHKPLIYALIGYCAIATLLAMGMATLRG